MRTQTDNEFYYSQGVGEKIHLAQILDKHLRITLAMGRDSFKDALHRMRSKLFEITINCISDENDDDLEYFMRSMIHILDAFDHVGEVLEADNASFDSDQTTDLVGIDYYFMQKLGDRKHLAEIIEHHLHIAHYLRCETLKDAAHIMRARLMELAVKSLSDEIDEDMEDFMIGINEFMNNLDEVANDFFKKHYSCVRKN